MKEVIELQNVWVNYGNVTVLEDVLTLQYRTKIS
jgi:hypothetical protein